VTLFAWLQKLLLPQMPKQQCGPKYTLPTDRSEIWPELKSAWIGLETRPGFCLELIEHAIAVEKNGLLHHREFDWCSPRPAARSTRKLSADDLAAIESILRQIDFDAIRRYVPTTSREDSGDEMIRIERDGRTEFLRGPFGDLAFDMKDDKSPALPSVEQLVKLVDFLFAKAREQS
jgi:hypothetical protein